MRSRLGLLACVVSLICIPAVVADPPSLEFDHIWIVVTRDAPERAALEHAGLKISPDVNRNDGQGTASVTTEFLNAYLELMWPDPTVPVSPGAERGVEKFKQRMNWHTSGWCPIGLGLHRASANTTLPFPTWSIAAAWMPAGSSIEILTPRDDTKSPSFFIEPPALMVNEGANRKLAENGSKRAAFQHPIGVERITALRLVRPKGYEPIPAFTYLEKAGIFKASQGEEWAIEVTFDDGRKGQTKDLRPDLPLILHY